MDEDLMMGLRIGLFVLCFGLALSIFVQTMMYFEAERECERMDDYKYLTNVEGSFWTRYDCYVMMQDGTKVDTDDFSIADYKIPISTQR